MCHLSAQDQYVCQIHHRIAAAVTCLLGGAQFSPYPFYHPRSSCCRFGRPREAAVCAGNFPDSNGISDDFKRQNRSHQTEPVPVHVMPVKLPLAYHVPITPAMATLAPLLGVRRATRLLPCP